MELRNSVKTALTTPGFCLVEALSQCPVQFGKLVTRDPSRLMKWIKDRTIKVDDAVRHRTTEGKMLVGEFTKAGKGLRPELGGLIWG
jgi:2-oxoglutarate ferredoxin oxidoreductase subunit beta